MFVTVSLNSRKIARYANYYKRFINFDVAHGIAGLSLLVSLVLKDWPNDTALRQSLPILTPNN